MGHQQLYWSHPRKFGQGSRSCRVCSNRHGLIRKYGLNMCRQCFRQYAKDIGFIKVSVGAGRRAERFLLFCLCLTSFSSSHSWIERWEDEAVDRCSCGVPRPP
uniref:Small ribosomal subunit protein uS14 n=1 Tax=Cairina moschata TaxID=8855 RepID=A0A8C3BYT7_CAIMO